jgi:uncharacterized radical SAM superfamily Fe-S cluster-containing enzyme
MEIIYNQKGGKTLSFEGQMYVVDRENNEKTIWRCLHKNECKARLHVANDGIDLFTKYILKYRNCFFLTMNRFIHKKHNPCWTTSRIHT